MLGKAIRAGAIAYNPPVSAPFLSLIVPAYNEARRLPDTLDQIAAFVKQQSYEVELLIVENGSDDGTFAVAAEFSNRNPAFKAVHLDERGKGLAVQFGMLETRGEYRMMLDADLSMPVDQITRFIPPAIEGKDIVIASREAPGAVRYNEPQYRHIGGRAINLLIRALALPNLHDSQCGFKCFRAEVAEDLFAQQEMVGWSFDVEVLFIARLRGYSITELAIPWYYNEQSHVDPIRDSARMFVDLLRIRRNAKAKVYERQG